MIKRLAWIVFAIALTIQCAAKHVWIDKTATLETYPSAAVRVYRAGVHCRVEIIMPTVTIVTLPTQCLDVPHMQRP